MVLCVNDFIHKTKELVHLLLLQLLRYAELLTQANAQLQVITIFTIQRSPAVIFMVTVGHAAHFHIWDPTLAWTRSTGSCVVMLENVVSQLVILFMLCLSCSIACLQVTVIPFLPSCKPPGIRLVRTHFRQVLLFSGGSLTQEKALPHSELITNYLELWDAQSFSGGTQD